MSTPHICPQCSAPLAPGARAGLCPVCMLTVDLRAPNDPVGAAPALNTGGDAPTAILGGSGSGASAAGSSPGADSGGRTEIVGSAKAAPSVTMAATEPPGLGVGRYNVLEGPGTIIGRYKLLEQIGEGGFGTVWMAEQSEPVRRRVALKVIKMGMDTKEVVGRFEAERQALAMMDHPSIARVFDGGVTDAGRPFFVMELVRGMPITKFCDARKMPMDERLVLFMHVCYAVQHAHQKGIIHRDIKPSNILVTEQDGEPLPKVIDFGVAKALHQPLTDRTVFTQFEQWIGTPAYMSPEQAGMGGLDVDTRSDIYALGVLLYELLTGRLPFTQEELFKTGVDAGLRIIREKEPPKPSNRVTTMPNEELTTVATSRQSEPRKLSRLLRGELDWIVMKAMEKDRKRRYETANGLALDLQRYLQQEPVSAAAPSWRYQFGKVARRHRVALGVGAGFVLILVAATVLSLWQASRATRAEGEAKQAKVQAEKQRTQAEANFGKARDAVERYLTAVTDNPKLNESDFHALRRQLLETAVPFYEQFVEQNNNDPKLRADQAAALGKLAQVYRTVGDLTKAEASNLRALGIHGKLAADFPDVADYRHELARNHDITGGLLAQRGQSVEAEAAYRRALEITGKVTADFPAGAVYWQTLALSHGNLGMLLRARGDSAEAEAEYRRALSIQERLAAKSPGVADYRQDLAKTHSSLANLLSLRGEFAAAEAAYRRALAIQEKLAAEIPTVPVYRVTLANSQNNFANLLSDRGQWEEAEKANRQALETREKLAADFPTVPEYRSSLASSQQNLAKLLAQRGQTVEAEAGYRKAVGTTERLAADFPGVPDYRQDLARSHGTLGDLLGQRRQMAEAETEYRRALEILERLAADFPGVPVYRVNLANGRHSMANLLRQRGSVEEAEATFGLALEVEEKLAADFPTVPEYRVNLAGIHHNFGGFLGQIGQVEEAGKAFRRALEIQTKLAKEFPGVPEYRQDLAKSHGSVGNLLSQRGEQAEAEAAYRRALEIQEKLAADFPAAPAYQSVLGSTLNNLAMVLNDGKQWEEARALYERAIGHQRKALAADPKNPLYSQFLRAHFLGLCQACISMGDHASAVATAIELPKRYREGWQEYQRAAGLVARCVPVAQEDPALSRDERDQLAGSYAEQAVDLLRRAIANGYKDTGKLKTAKEFSAIRERADFQALLGEGEEKPGAK